jgi:glucose-1-phosphate thymidylyltransferase
VNFALIDATAGSPPDHPADCRYATPIANMPLICHVFDELAQNGIDHARIIARPSVSEDIERILGRGDSWGMQVSYLDTPVLNGRQVVLAELDQALSQGPVLLHPGDTLLRGQMTRMQERFHVGDVDSVLPEQASPGPRRDPEDRRVSNTVLALGPGTRRVFGELLCSEGDEADLIDTLLHSDCRLAVCEQTEHWSYSGSTSALLSANRMLLDSLADTPPDPKFGDGNEVQGRVLISPEAWISTCVLHGPIAIDARAVIEDSFIGPYTAIGPDVILRGVEIDNSMILTGAEVVHPGSRIEASIIGERARVVRSFELPRGLHLRLGPDSQVNFS